MKLLVTGASGFLGRRAATYFEKMGWTVLKPSHAELDITDRKQVEAWFRTNKPKAVLHCAAVSDTGACQREPERTARINVDGSVHLAAACAAIGAKLVFCSSDQVYAGSPLPGPHREEERLSPGNVYAQQKWLAEQRCSEICPNAVLLRLSWMYATQSLPGEHGHFLKTLLAALSDDSLPLTWPVHDRRGITDVDAVVRNLPAALELPAGVYNFGAENDRDTYHTVRSVLTELGQTRAVQRLTSNTEAFADAPRDIRMDLARSGSFGIIFDSTAEGLYHALQRCIL